MSYQQIRDILKQVAAFHESIHTIVAEAVEEVDVELIDTESADDERRAWLMRYVEGQSNALAQALSRQQHEGRTNVLDTWLQYVPYEHVERRLLEMGSASDLDPEELLEHVQGFDEALRDLYSTLADQSSIPDVQELFETLGRQSQSLLEQKAWGMRSDEENAAEESVDE